MWVADRHTGAARYYLVQQAGLVEPDDLLTEAELLDHLAAPGENPLM
jgi:hypothetical protein